MSDKKHAGISLEGGKRLALVVGVNSVPKSLLPPLQSACRDAETVAHVLETYCHFTLLEPPLLEERATSAAIKKAILDLMEQGEANDFLLFYFSGHGQPMDVEAGRNEVYLGTYDFVEKQVERDETLHLSLLWLRDKLFQQTVAEKVLLVLDCCYSGEVGRIGPDPYLEELQQRLSYYFGRPGATTGAPTGGLRQALTATGHNTPAQESRVHGRMTSFLLSALRGEVQEALGQQKLLTLWRLVDYLKESYEQPPKPALSGDDAGQDCILAYFPSTPTSKITASSGSTDTERPASYLPFPRNPIFQPRPGEFEHLEHLLFASDTQQSVPLGLVGVTGMGGVGKTQLAVELAYRYQQRFPGGIFWIPATGQNLFDWQHTLSELAVKTSFLPPGDDPANPEHEVLRARYLCRYFASRADALVILDNAEVPQLVTTALVDLAGGALACTVLYTSRQRTPLAGVALYPVEVLSEEGALRLLLESTRPALLAEVLAGGTSTEVKAAYQTCRATGALPLALIILQSLLARDRKLSLHTLANTLQERGVLTLPSAGSQQATLEETFQLSWQQVRDERARRFFLLVSLFPEATPVPLWLAGLAAGLGERTQPFDPLWEISLSLQELSLLEGLADDQVRLHPLVRAFGQQMLEQEQAQGHLLRAEAGSRLLDAFNDLALLEKRARRINYRDCLEQLRAARDYALLLDEPCANQLNRLERWLDRESHLLADERWWPETIPGLFYQQFFNRGVETGEPLKSQESPTCWLKQTEAVGAEDRALLRIFRGNQGWVNSVAFSPDGCHVLTGSEDAVRLWEATSGRLLVTLKGGGVSSVAFSPNGQLILAGYGSILSSSNTARLWNSTTGELLLTLEVPSVSIFGDGVSSVAFSPNGQLILTGHHDKTARLWNRTTGQLLCTLEGHQGSLRDVAFSPNGQLILTGSGDRTARLWEAASGQLLFILAGHHGLVVATAFSPDGKLVLTGSYDHTAQIWEVASGQLLRTLEGHQDWVKSVAFSPDGRLILTGSEDQTARLWEAASGQLLCILEGHQGGVESVAFSPDGKLILAGSIDGTARLWEVAPEQPLSLRTGHQGEIDSVTFSPDGRLILTGSHDHTAKLWEVASGRHLRTFEGHEKTVGSVAFSSDGKLILTGSWDRTAKLWDSATGELLHILKGHQGEVYCVAFSPDGRLACTGSQDQTARLWDSATGELLRTLKLRWGRVTSMAFSPDGRLALIDEMGYTAQLWDSATGELLHILEDHQGYVRTVAFSPDGQMVLTGSVDGTAKLWDSTTGQPLFSLAGHQNGVRSAAFSPDGKLIVTCDYYGQMYCWANIGARAGKLLALYPATYRVFALHWLDSVNVLLADNGGPRNKPNIYQLLLEGSDWRE